ncbi:MAG: DUF4129 domain-containing protein [Chloroflexi bacterium]|nr:DUF4129 domain-containing protein [Chloroflexota bacterium]
MLGSTNWDRSHVPLALTARESFFGLLVVGALAWMPAWSIQLAAWSENLDLVPWMGLGGVLAGWALARSGWRAPQAHLLGILSGAATGTLFYSRYLPSATIFDGTHLLLARVGQWFAAALSGGASTDNLLFAFSMALLAWLSGYVGAWGAFRMFTPWLAVVPTSTVLLLNLSYAPTELLPLTYLQLVAGFLLMMNVSSLRHVAAWRIDNVARSLNQGAGFALGGAGLGVGIVLLAFQLPTGEVSRAVSNAWDTVSGPWQDAQATFDRLFASLNPSPLSSRGLSITQSLAPRGSFDLGTDPVYRVTGQRPAYWRGSTYDKYTGQLMTSTNATSVRRDRRQPLAENSQAGTEGRTFVEYTFTMLALGSSILHAPDAPVTVNLPVNYDYRGDFTDIAFIRPVISLRQQQQYSVLASVSTASTSELKRASTIYPPWTRAYLQLPDFFPDAVRQEAWRVVGDSTTTYEAAANVEDYLRTLTYKTRVAVPPPGRDWVSFLLFDSKEGYCDYYATAMAVMLRSVGIPTRVATGYVAGDWDDATQSYQVNENHAHAWTEVYFPGYGWITFEPSANRPLPPRFENPLVAESEEDIKRLLESEGASDQTLDEEDLGDEGDVTPLSDAGGSGGPPIGLILLATLALLGISALVLGPGAWARQISRLPSFARPYARVVRLAGWVGLGPKESQTPYEYTAALAKALPEAAEAIETVGAGYVEGLYGRKLPDANAMERLQSAGGSAANKIIRSFGIETWRRRIARLLQTLVGERH